MRRIGWIMACAAIAALALGADAQAAPPFPTLTEDFSIRIEVVLEELNTTMSMLQFYDFTNNRAMDVQYKAGGASTVVQYLYPYLTRLTIENGAQCTATPIDPTADPNFNATTGHLIPSNDLLFRSFAGAGAPEWIGEATVRAIPVNRWRTVAPRYEAPSASGYVFTLYNFSTVFSFAAPHWSNPSAKAQVPVELDMRATIYYPPQLDPDQTPHPLHHVFSYFDYDVGTPMADAFLLPAAARCPSLNRSRDALPPMPDRFGVQLEMTFAEAAVTVNAVEHFDRTTNRVRVDMSRPLGFLHDPNAPLHATTTFYYYDQLLRYDVVDGKRCTATPISAADRARRVDPATGRLNAHDLDYFTPFLQNLNFSYAGTAVARAILCDRWSATYKGPIGPTQYADFGIDFFWTVDHWFTRNRAQGVRQTPVALQFDGNTYWNNGSLVGPMTHRYVYTNFVVGDDAANAGADPATGAPDAAADVFALPTLASCPSVNRSRDALPPMPAQFSVQLEVNLATGSVGAPGDGGATLNVVEYYDRPNNRVRLDQTHAANLTQFPLNGAGTALGGFNPTALDAPQTPTSTFLDYNRGTRFTVVNGAACVVSAIGAAERARRIDPATGLLNSHNFDYFTPFLTNLAFAYHGTSVVRAIAVDRWAVVYSGPISATLNATLAIDFFWTAAGAWHTRNRASGVAQTPVALQMDGDTWYMANGSHAGTLSRRYVYTNLVVPHELVDPQTGLRSAPGFANATFQPPTAAGCSVDPSRPLPRWAARRQSFTVQIEINRLESGGTLAVTEYYDFEGGRVRLDRYPATANLILNDIYDYAAAVHSQFQTYFDWATGAPSSAPTCVEGPLRDATRYNASAGSLSADSFDYFFLNAANALAYVYTGQQTVRGISADTWTAPYTGPYVDFTNSSLTVDWSFTPLGWHSYAIGLHRGEPVPLRVHVRGVGIRDDGVPVPLEHSYEYSQWSWGRPPSALFPRCNPGGAGASSSSGGITGGQLAGAVIGSILGSLVLAAVCVHCYYRRRISRGDFARLEDGAHTKTVAAARDVPVASQPAVELNTTPSAQV